MRFFYSFLFLALLSIAQITFGFSDVPKNTPLSDALTYLEQQNIIKKTYNYFPERNILRIDALKQTFLAGNIPIEESNTSSFSDISSQYKHANIVETAVNTSIVEGRNIKGIRVFAPFESISYAESLKIVLESFQINSMGTCEYKEQLFQAYEQEWFFDYLTRAASYNLLPNQYESIDYSKSISKKDWALLLYKTMNISGSNCNTKEEVLIENALEEDTYTPVLSNAALTIFQQRELLYESLGIPQNGIVNILPLRIEANKNILNITSISIKLTGLANNNSIDDVWIVDANNRPITSDTSFRSNNIATATFSGKGLEVIPGKPVFIVVRASFKNADPSSTFQFSIEEVLYNTMLDINDPTESGLQFNL